MNRGGELLDIDKFLRNESLFHDRQEVTMSGAAALKDGVSPEEHKIMFFTDKVENVILITRVKTRRTNELGDILQGEWGDAPDIADLELVDAGGNDVNITIPFINRVTDGPVIHSFKKDGIITEYILTYTCIYYIINAFTAFPHLFIKSMTLSNNDKYEAQEGDVIRFGVLKEQINPPFAVHGQGIVDNLTEAMTGAFQDVVQSISPITPDGKENVLFVDFFRLLYRRDNQPVFLRYEVLSSSASKTWNFDQDAIEHDYQVIQYTADRYLHTAILECNAVVYDDKDPNKSRISNLQFRFGDFFEKDNIEGFILKLGNGHFFYDPVTENANKTLSKLPDDAPLTNHYLWYMERLIARDKVGVYRGIAQNGCSITSEYYDDNTGNTIYYQTIGMRGQATTFGYFGYLYKEYSLEWVQLNTWLTIVRRAIRGVNLDNKAGLIAFNCSMVTTAM